MVDNVFILAGGAGTRLWPASNRLVPKQFLKVEKEKSLLLLTIERALSLHINGEIYIITLKEQMSAVITECRKLGEGREKIVILPEPEPKNTAPAVAAAAGYLRSKGRGAESILVMPADHLILPLDKFADDVEKADRLAKKGLLVTFGIQPFYPATGYGYIEAGSSNGTGFSVKRFREKPDQKTAENFITQGNFYWNSGMFVFSLDTFWQELLTYAPDIEKVFRSIGKADAFETVQGIGIILHSKTVREIYAASPKNSIDYAVMEKSKIAAVVPASFDWNDIGSWDEMAEIYAHPAAGDIRDTVFPVEASNNYVLSDIPVALCGVDDLIVVQKNGALLICKKGKGQLVKNAVELLKKHGKNELL